MNLPRFDPTWRRTTLLLTLLCCTIAACGADTPEAAPAVGGPVPTVTAPLELPIVVAITGFFDDGTLAILDGQIAAFEAANPDIKIEVVAAPREADARREAFASLLKEGDNSRDVYVVNPTWLAQFTAAGWLTPLDDYVKLREIEAGDFLAPSIQASTVDGQLVALPWSADGGLLYYRQDLLEKYGYDPPSTWADLQRLALDIKARERLSFGFVWQGAAYESLTCNTLEFVWACGGDVLDQTGNAVFDSAETRAALQQMIDLVASDASPPEIAAYQEAAALAAFQTGDAILMRNWAYAWDRVTDDDSAVAGKVGVAPLPSSCLGGSSLALSTHSQYPEQAFRFMAFLVGHDQQAQLALHGVQPPALEPVYRDADLLAVDPSLEALHAALSIARPRPESAVYPQLSEAIYTQVNKMLAGEQDVVTTAAGVQRRLEAILGR